MEVLRMGKILVSIAVAGAGFWLGSYHLIPLWAILLLLAMGTGLWLAAEWMERQGGNDDD